ncbi:flagellar protein flil [Plakobranchus ocellatus]|uniref:Flagellar protein flil n=1 Tax=Plakobranchus ocellatus TaxID=259542 RepID=A0AAV4AI81_9GAST|nr:flagellar protein flil [Plakobranchus ocellatus]
MNVSRLERPSVQMRKMSSMYLSRIFGLVAADANNLSSSSPMNNLRPELYNGINISKQPEGTLCLVLTERITNVTNLLPQTKVVVTSSSNNSSVSVFQTTTKNKPNRCWVKRNVYKRKQTLFNTTNATVINFSSHILTDPQTQLLSRNLNFCPTPHHINHIELSEDIHRFCRRLRLPEFFYDEENTKPHEPLPSFLQKPSSFTPNADRDPALDAFIKAVTKDLMTCQPRKCFPNIRTEEKRALAPSADSIKRHFGFTH